MIPILHAGETLREIHIKDGRKATIRAPRWEDLDDLLALINGLVAEKADILRVQGVKREEEAEWLAQRLADLENGRLIALVAEVEGRVVASCEVTLREGVQSHLGSLGIATSSGFRDLGLGHELMQALLELSKKAGLKVIVLHVYATNNRARHLYEKAGFRGYGILPKGILRDGTYVDLVNMVIEF